MWLFANIGFFSVVQKSGTDFLTIRARVASDLGNLRKSFMPGLSPTTTKGGTDYPYRATINHGEFAAGLAKLGETINYSNFKNEVAEKMGSQRAHTYSKVWQDLVELESGRNR